MNGSAARGPVTRFQQFGIVSIVICVAIGAFITVQIGRTHPAQLAIADALIFASAILLSTLTIEVDDIGLRWFFTGGLFGSTLAYGEIATMTTRNVLPLGFGYRVGPSKRAWLISGRSVLVIQLSDSEMQYMIGAHDPEAVREEIERRWKR